MGLLLAACNGAGQKNVAGQPQQGQSALLQKNTVNETSTMPYRLKDSLLARLSSNWQNSDIEKLNNLCARSDGDLSEGLTDDLVNLLYKQPDALVGYLIHHSHSCIKQRLIEGFGAQVSPYKKTDRPAMMEKEKNLMLKRAGSLNLSADKKAYIEYLYKQADPNVLD